MVDRAQNEIVSVAVVLHQSGFPQIEHGRFFETLLYPTLLIIRTFSPSESTDCQQLICLRDCGAVKHDFLLTNVRFHRFLTGRKWAAFEPGDGRPDSGAWNAERPRAAVLEIHFYACVDEPWLRWQDTS